MSVPCPYCDGEGFYSVFVQGSQDKQRECERCNGNGEIEQFGTLSEEETEQLYNEPNQKEE